jgi:predicted dehydrogenase
MESSSSPIRRTDNIKKDARSSSFWFEDLSIATPELRIAVVGFGSIARTHISALAAMPAVTPLPFRPVVHTLISQRIAEVKEDAVALGIQHLASSVEEALDDPDLRAFDVTTVNRYHVRDAGPVLRAGRPLYIEKPAGRTPSEAAQLAELAGRSPAPSQVGLVERYHPNIVQVRALLRAGAIGELRHARLAILHGSYLNPARPVSWRLENASAGGGAMLDLGLHQVDLASFLFGELSVSAARSRTVVNERPDGKGGTRAVDVDDWAWAELQTATGAAITVEASRIALGAEGTTFELYGTQGSLVGQLDSRTPPTLTRFDREESSYWRPVDADPEVRAVLALLPPPRLSLGIFVDTHLASLHHFLLRVAGHDPLPGYGASLADSAIGERLVATITSPGD